MSTAEIPLKSMARDSRKQVNANLCVAISSIEVLSSRPYHYVGCCVRCVLNSILIVYEIVMKKSTGANDLFSERLRAARTQRGLSQGGLAKRAGLQPSAVSHFETGLRKPSYENLRRVADALDVTTDFLLGRVLEMKGLASGDPLFQDIERLTSDDRDLALDFVKLLADRVRRREP